MSNNSDNSRGAASSGNFFAPLLAGPPHYRIQSNWPVGLGVALAVAIFAASIGLSLGAVMLLLPDRFASSQAEDPIAAAAVTSYAGGLAIVVYQVMTIILVWLVAGGTTAARRTMLALKPWPPQTIAPATVVVFATGAVFLTASLVFVPEMVRADLQPFIDGLQQPGWWFLALAVVVGAPLSEELLFRGFLLPVLAQTRMGFVGAVLISNTVWTALHAGYSAAGLIDVFLAGLIFSWLLWRTGSLWTTIVLHGLYNAVLLVGMIGVYDVQVGGGAVAPASMLPMWLSLSI